MTQQGAPHSEDVPYDRELIRSGRASGGRGGRGQPSYEPPQPRATGSPARSGSRRILRRSLVVLGVGIAVVVLVLLVRVAAFNASVSSAFFPSTSLLGPLNGSDRVNVVLIGYGGGEHGGAYLADSIQIQSIDPETHSTTTIPIPRDLWIEGLEQYPGDGKVNEVFATGHAEADGDEAARLDRAGALMAAVLSEVTNLQIHHWLAIDFAGFQEMVDTVGGVTVDNPVAFEYTMVEANYHAGVWDGGAFEAGEIHLDGAGALAYSRARYTSVPSESNDFARSIRQARILAALRAELGDGGIGSILPGLRVMDAMEGRVRTDLSAIDLFLLSSHLSGDRRVELAEGSVLTATTNAGGQYILVPAGWAGAGDYGGLQAYLAAELPASTDATP